MTTILRTLAAIAIFGLGAACIPAMAVTELSNVTRIASGFYHACVLLPGGVLECWGYNGGGQLGDGTLDNRAYPAPVNNLPSGITRMALGAGHTCAITSTGGVKCWGGNDRGQLGDGTTTRRPEPVDVVGLTSGVAEIQASFFGTCALTTSGGVKCWGGDLSGNVATGGSLVPVDVFGLTSGVTAITRHAAAAHTCAIANAGVVKCWGNNQAGQLGDGSFDNRTTPVDVVGLSSGVVSLAAGSSRTCAIMQNGSVKCWGQGYGATPVDVPSLPAGIVQLANYCALTSGGVVKCIGNTGAYVDQPGLPPTATAIAIGASFGCAVQTDTHVKCWGFNAYGSLGNNNFNEQSGPVPVIDVVPPGPPVSVIAWAGDGIASFTFGPPADDGGSAVQRYTVTCNPGAVSATAAASPVTVPGLANGTAYACSVTASSRAGTGVASGTVNVTPSAAPVVHALTGSPSPLNAGQQSMSTTSPPFPVTITNSSAGTINVTAVTVSSASPQFAQTNNCGTLAAGASCTVQVTYSPPISAGPLLTTVTARPTVLSIGSDDATGPLTVSLTGTAEKSLVTHYYRSILRRDPEPAGTSYWNGEAGRAANLGINVNETWFAMAQTFFSSPEYIALNRDNDGFVVDLYRTFFNRAPDIGGRFTWVGQLDQGLPREVLLAQFLFSLEFSEFTRAIFGGTVVRAEVNALVDFYRGFFSRLPDNDGFAFWLARFRAAQCQGAASVTAQADAISKAFLDSPEYTARGRTNPEYVGDLYNAFLRRGGDLQGVQYWINQVATRSREAVRVDFRNSPEFQARVNAIIAQGCAS